jgi:hypothetical protein
MGKIYDSPLDEGIKDIVILLNENGVETFESCQGGKGHTMPEPTVRFHGEYYEGLRALSVALANNLNVVSLRRNYNIQNGEITGPWWEMIFTPHHKPVS